jgi:hypothetical protein
LEPLRGPFEAANATYEGLLRPRVGVIGAAAGGIWERTWIEVGEHWQAARDAVEGEPP